MKLYPYGRYVLSRRIDFDELLIFHCPEGSERLHYTQQDGSRFFQPNSRRQEAAMPNLTKSNKHLGHKRQSIIALLQRFRRNEVGGITIMGIMLLISMLVVGGMAVDFMMFEARRATLQGVSDRAVLASAKLGQEFDTEAEVEAYSQGVVLDYFEIAGQTNNLKGLPEVEVLGGRRSVNVNANLDVGTNYLRLIGIDNLESAVNSSAVEAESNIEISLVLDTSYSMSEVAADSTRMELLQLAAVDFVDTLLTPDLPVPEFKDQISISLVSYSSQVSLGNDIYNAINAESPVFVQGDDTFVNPSRCVEMPDDEFDNAAWNDGTPYKQIEHFGMFGGVSSLGSLMVLDTPICPTAAGNHIIPMSQNASELTTAINQLEPYLNTSIQEGMKWGMTLLDPSFRPILDKIGSIDPAFKGIRPTDYPVAGGVIDTVKYVVLMTDGENARNYRLK